MADVRPNKMTTKVIFVVLLCLSISSCSRPKQQHEIYNIHISPSGMIVNNVMISTNELRDKVIDHVRNYGQTIRASISMANDLPCGVVFTNLIPLTSFATVFFDFKLTEIETNPIPVIALTAALDFTVAKEDLILIDGVNVHTRAGNITLNELDTYLSETKGTNLRFRVDYNATSRTKASELYNALGIVRKYADDFIVWDLEKEWVEQWRSD